MSNRQRKYAIWVRDGWKCQYCGSKVVPWSQGMDQNQPDIATVDHIKPVARGGRGGDNLVTACFSCNQSKADKVVEPDAAPAPTLGDLWPMQRMH